MTQTSRPLLAALWMTGAIVSFSAMAVAGREILDELSSFELMMYRSFIGLGIVLIFGFATGKIRNVRIDRLPLHGLRNLAHFIGQNLWFSAIPLITLAQVFALEFTTPIWVVIFAVLFAGEKLTRPRMLAVALGFIGALLVARPGVGGDPLGLALAAASAICFACSIVTTKLLTRTETVLGVLFWLTVMQAVMGLIAGLLAMPLGVMSAWILANVVNRRAFGWSMEFHIDFGVLAEGVAIAVLAAFIAGALAALSLYAQSPASALRYE